MSGLMPLLTRRNALKIAARSKITLVLLCSASETCGIASSGSATPGSLTNRTSVPDAVRTADESIKDSRNCGASVSYRPSNPVRSAAAPMVATVLYSETGAVSHCTITW